MNKRKGLDCQWGECQYRNVHKCKRVQGPSLLECLLALPDQPYGTVGSFWTLFVSLFTPSGNPEPICVMIDKLWKFLEEGRSHPVPPVLPMMSLRDTFARGTITMIAKWLLTVPEGASVDTSLPDQIKETAVCILFHEPRNNKSVGLSGLLNVLGICEWCFLDDLDVAALFATCRSLTFKDIPFGVTVRLSPGKVSRYTLDEMSHFQHGKIYVTVPQRHTNEDYLNTQLIITLDNFYNDTYECETQMVVSGGQAHTVELRGHLKDLIAFMKNLGICPSMLVGVMIIDSTKETFAYISQLLPDLVYHILKTAPHSQELQLVVMGSSITEEYIIYPTHVDVGMSKPKIICTGLSKENVQKLDEIKGECPAI